MVRLELVSELANVINQFLSFFTRRINRWHNLEKQGLVVIRDSSRDYSGHVLESKQLVSNIGLQSKLVIFAHCGIKGEHCWNLSVKARPKCIAGNCVGLECRRILVFGRTIRQTKSHRRRWNCCDAHYGNYGNKCNPRVLVCPNWLVCIFWFSVFCKVSALCNISTFLFRKDASSHQGQNRWCSRNSNSYGGND